MQRESDKSGRVSATLEQKEAMFEWLRGIATGDGKDWRKAAIAMNELNDYAELRRAPVSSTATTGLKPYDDEVSRKTWLGETPRTDAFYKDRFHAPDAMDFARQLERESEERRQRFERCNEERERQHARADNAERELAEGHRICDDLLRVNAKLRGESQPSAIGASTGANADAPSTFAQTETRQTDDRLHLKIMAERLDKAFLTQPKHPIPEELVALVGEACIVMDRIAQRAEVGTPIAWSCAKSPACKEWCGDNAKCVAALK